MAKISFTKLGLKTNQEVITFEYNGQIIEVKQYLPINDKLKIIGNVLENSADKNNFANPVKIEVFTILEIFYNYTNINFTDKQKEEPTKLYDLLVSSGIVEKVIENMKAEEYNAIVQGAKKVINAYYEYKNSVLGIIETVNTDYSNLNFDVEALQEKMANPNDLNLLKDILTKLG